MTIAAACVGEHVSSTTQPTITLLSTQNYAFADQFVGTTSAPHTVTIFPASGEQSDTVTSIVMSCTDFSLTNVPTLPQTVSSHCNGLDGSGECTGYSTKTLSFNALFSPLAANQTPETCTIYVTLNNDMPSLSCNAGGSHQCVVLSGRGIEPAIRVTASPPTVDFGDVRVGDTATQMVTVTNHGSDTNGASVTSVTTTPVPPYGVTGGTTAHVLPANGGADKDLVSCTPTSLGTGLITGTMALVGAQNLSVGLTCHPIMSSLAIQTATGINTSFATLAGSQSDGSTRVGEPIDVTMTLLNDPAVSTASLTIHGVSITPSNNNPDLSITDAPPAETMLAVGAKTTVTIHYAATTAYPYGMLGALNIDVDSGPVRTANIQGGAVDTSMSLSGDGNLGPICSGISTSKMIEVQKNNTGTFLVTSITQPDAPFSVTGGLPSPSTPIAVTGTSTTVSDQLTITADPTTVGNLTSSFTITTDIPNTAPVKVPIKATALAAGVSPTPASLDFGTVNVNSTSIAQMVTITNCNADPMTLMDAQITGTALDDFAIVVPPDSNTVPPGSAATYRLVISPKQNGDRSATLVITEDTGTVTVPLVGAGVNGPDTFGSATYYTCSTGRGTASWPIAAMVLLVMRRRRRRS